MDKLSDPRRFFASGAGHPLLEPVAAVIAAEDREQRPRRTALRARLHAHLLRGEDAFIAEAFAAMPDALHFRTLFEELAQAVDAPSRVTLRLAQPHQARYWLVWLTKLPKGSGGFHGGVAELTFESGS